MTTLPPHHAKRVYLSGGMEYAPNEGRDWRSTLQEWLERELRCEVFNPNAESEKFLGRVLPGIDFRQLKLDNLERFREVVQEIVDLDCREIAEKSDYVICYWDRSAAQGAGTKGEITMARYFGNILPSSGDPGMGPRLHLTGVPRFRNAEGLPAPVDSRLVSLTPPHAGC
jgi:hypothetical protein